MEDPLFLPMSEEESELQSKAKSLANKDMEARIEIVKQTPLEK